MRILGETVALAETKKLTNLYVPTLLALHPAISIILDLYLWTRAVLHKILYHFSNRIRIFRVVFRTIRIFSVMKLQ